MKFQRIQDLRIDNDLTIKEISAMLGLHRDVYSRYEKGLRDFPIDILIKLADIYHCSIDYLVGRLIRSNIIHKMPTPQTLITIYKEKTDSTQNRLFFIIYAYFFPRSSLMIFPSYTTVTITINATVTRLYPLLICTPATSQILVNKRLSTKISLTARTI